MLWLRLLLIISLLFLTRCEYEPPIIDIMVESLCPDSINFFEGSFASFYKHPNHEQLAIVNFIPFGNAQEKWNGEKWEFTCQHKENECYGNIMETCGIHILGREKSYSFLICMNYYVFYFRYNFNQTLQYCQKDSKLLKDIKACATGELGNKLEHEAAQKTPADKTHVPWIMVNGKYDPKVEENILRDMLGYLCSQIPGGCLQAYSEPRALSEKKCLNDLILLEN